MSYMEMELRNETGEASTKGICLNFGNFIDDLDFSSDMDYYQSEEYPIERYHAKMRELLEKAERRQQELPLLFSIPLSDDVREDTSVERLNDLYSTYASLPADLKEDCAELLCWFTDLDELHSHRHDIIHYSWCKNMADVAKHLLDNDPAFAEIDERLVRYFDFEAYGQYLDDNGHFVETEHGIYELP